MSSNALDSQGVTLEITSNSPILAIPEISNIQGPGGQANEIDVTDLNSTAKEFRMGLQDEGSITLDIMYIPGNAAHAALRAARAAQALTTFRLTFTDADATTSPVTTNTTWTFTAFVLGFEISNSVDDVTKASVTLRVSGAVVEA
jgi:hypothetical protein